MFDDKNLLFSPWFRLIAKRWMIGGKGDETSCGDEKEKQGGGGWWDDLERTMTTNDFCDYGTIHRFDPPSEHMGGGGDAGPMFDGTETNGTAAAVGDSS